jgi:hypothetical protein
MGLETAQAFRADGKYQYGCKTGGANIQMGGVFTGTSIGVVATGTRYGVDAVAAEGIGVSGQSRGEAKGKAVGVMGSCQAKEGRGVEGSGPTGVYGSGSSGRGGVFRSKTVAQINLVPDLEKLPVEGQIGDLIVILAQRKLDDKNTTVTVPEIWFCGRDGDSKNPALWAQVQVSFFVQAKP